MKPRFTKKRIRQLDQLINDIAEDMEVDRYKVKDFVDCINYQQDELVRLHRKNIEDLTAHHEHVVSLKAAVCDTVGGTVEGWPTHFGNYLQRLRQLVRIEKRVTSLNGIPPINRPNPHLEKPQV